MSTSTRRDQLLGAAQLLTGADMASTRQTEDVPRLVMSDGPSGLAMNLPDFAGKVPATSFPSPSALAATWDVDLLAQVGSAIGAEARAAGADILLGPSVNIKRSPLGGRNFEYYAEDPFLAGRVGAAFVRGVQSEGVGACIKHFAVNSQESDRMRVSAEVSERALREIYLPAFEHIVRTTGPAMVMASYNRINGQYAAQSPRLLTQILREEWGFTGVVVSDWGAVDDPVRAVAAGLDIQMPGPADAARDAIVDAVASGELETSTVFAAAERVAQTARAWSGLPARAIDHGAHEKLARRVAERSVVLLRNEGQVLPLAGTGTLLVLGELARAPRREGGGSAHVGGESSGETPLDALRASWIGEVRFDAAYGDDGSTLRDLEDCLAQASDADAVVVFAGPPAGTDSEGYDRSTIELPPAQVRLIEEVSRTARPTVVVLNAGGVVRTSPWEADVAAVLHTWLPGGHGAGAIADILVGNVNPAGKLTETFPLAIEDSPTFPGFPATDGRALHAEGVLVGYRWYDRVGKDVAYPFGHGLSYTTFEYSALEVSTPSDASASTGDGPVHLSFLLSNTGERAGTEIWQAYLERAGASPDAAVRELVGFGAVTLEPGTSQLVRFTVEAPSFRIWSEETNGWFAPGGEHTISVGSSSRDLRCVTGVSRRSDRVLVPLTQGSTLREWVRHDVYGPLLLEQVAEADPSGRTTGFITDTTVLTMIGDMPVHRLFGDTGNALSAELLQRVRQAADRREQTSERNDR